MKHGLFINQKKTQCSIYESGVMISNVLKTNPKFKLDYIETRNAGTGAYDFCVINWHHVTLPLKKDKIQSLPGVKIGINLETFPDITLPYMPADIFDAYMIIDPTKKREKNLYPFPRPLEIMTELRPILSENIPVIGSFGFYGQFSGKKFHEIIENYNNTGEKCIIRFNFPTATFIPNGQSDTLKYAEHLKKIAKKNIDLRITYDYMNKTQLIQWCSEHAINIFPYYRNYSGLSAVTDQAISANRAIAVTPCATFRHIHKYIPYYPVQNYNTLIKSTLDGVKQMQIDWHPDKFNETFNAMLTEQGVL